MSKPETFAALLIPALFWLDEPPRSLAANVHTPMNSWLAITVHSHNGVAWSDRM